MKGSEFIFDSIDVLYHNLNKISLVRDGTYIDTPKRIKNKKVTINPKKMMTNAVNMLQQLH